MYVAGEGGGHVVRDARMPSLCRGLFPVPGSVLVLHLRLCQSKTRTHTVLSPPPSLTPMPRRIAFELEADLDDWQSILPRSCRRA